MKRAGSITLEDLVDIEAIKQLKARYFRYLDTRAWDAWGQLFTDGCRAYCLPDPDDCIEGREAFVTFVRAGITPGVSVHHGHMPEITIDGGDHAVGIWAMYDYVQTEDGRLHLQGYGHYHEEYVRTPDGWRIDQLRLTRLRVDDLAVPPGD